MADIVMPFSAPLAEPGGEPEVLRFTIDQLATVRRWVERYAIGRGLPDDRVADLVLAADEVAANSVLHGGGSGRLRCWFDGTAVVCEVRDDGRFGDIMAGRRIPTAERGSGYGLWIANQVCDLVQIRAFEDGSVVRLHLAR